MIVDLRVRLGLIAFVVISAVGGARAATGPPTNALSACASPSPTLKRALVPGLGPWASVALNKSSSLDNVSLPPLDSRAILARDPVSCCGPQATDGCCSDCCPDGVTCKPAGGVCCGAAEVCGSACCDAGTQCCGGTCIPTSATCCGNSTCNAGMQCCGGNCVPTSTVCCGDNPCDGECCQGTCIPKGTTCCNGKYCIDGKCCGGECTQDSSDVCCDTWSCSSGSTCCGSGCAASGQTCCNGTACASSCCGGKCCNNGETCCNGKCMPSNGTCCNGNICDGDCCNGSCMPKGKTCCPNGKQCDSGTTCCGDSCAKSTESCCGGTVCASSGGCCVDPSGNQVCADQCPNPGPDPQPNPKPNPTPNPTTDPAPTANVTSSHSTISSGTTRGSSTHSTISSATTQGSSTHSSNTNSQSTNSHDSTSTTGTSVPTIVVTRTSGGLGGSVIGGIVAAIILALILAAVLGWILFRFCKRHGTELSYVGDDHGSHPVGGDNGVGGLYQGSAMPLPVPAHYRDESTSGFATTGNVGELEKPAAFDPYAELAYLQPTTSASSNPATQSVPLPLDPSYNPSGTTHSPSPKSLPLGSSSRPLSSASLQPASPTTSSYSTEPGSVLYGGSRVLNVDGKSRSGSSDEKRARSGHTEPEDSSPVFAAGVPAHSPYPSDKAVGLSEGTEPRLSTIDSDARSTRSATSASTSTASPGIALPLDLLQPHQRDIVQSLQANRVSHARILEIFSRMVAENEQEQVQPESSTKELMDSHDQAPPSYELAETRDRQ